jgi:pimeloyl-ACP methyl ester carboxylesterase
MPKILLPSGVEICYETFGSSTGPTLLLIHGLGSQLLLWEEGFCNKLTEEGLHVIRYDQRDNGLSSEMKREYELSDMASDAAELLEQLSIKKAHIAGMSLGGMVAQIFAAEYPEKVSSLTSMASNTGKGGFGIPKGKALEALLAPAPIDPQERALKDLSDRRIWASTDWHDDEYCLKIFERYAERTNKSNEAKERQMRAMNSTGNREEALMKIKTPTLVLHGSADTLVDPSGGQRTAEVIPGAKFVMIEGWGHDLPPGSWPKITNEIIQHVKNAEKTNS